MSYLDEGDDARESVASHRRSHPFCVAVCLLRRFSLAGEDVQNPVKGFNREFRQSSDADGHLRHDSRLAVITIERFNHEKAQAEELSDVLWHKEASLSPEVLLLRLGEADRIFDSYKGESALSSSNTSFEDEELRSLAELLGYDIHLVDDDRQKYAKALVESERYLHNDGVLSLTAEGTGLVSCTDDTAMTIECECSYMFGEVATVVNPLVALRQRDDAEGHTFDSVDQRRDALVKLEGLSRRIWHLATSVGVNKLMARLMMEEDGGLRDLALLDEFAELLGARHRRPAGERSDVPKKWWQPEPLTNADIEDLI